MSLGSFVRSAFGVAVGYILFAIPTAALFGLTGHDPHAPASLGFMAASTALGILFSFMAGYLVAVISAPQKRPPWALAGLIALGALVSTLLLKPGESACSQIAAVILIAPAAVLGGLLRQRHNTVL